VHQLGVAQEHEGGIVVRKVLELGNPEPYYLVSLLEEPPEVSSTRWPSFNAPVTPVTGRERSKVARMRGFWEVKVRPLHRPTGLMAGGVQIVDDLWTVEPAEWLELDDSVSCWGSAEEALKVCIEHLRLFDAKRRMNVPALIP
jgi:hypothetical protein